MNAARRWLGLCLLATGLTVGVAGAKELVLGDVQPPEHPLIRAEEYMATWLAVGKDGLTLKVRDNGQMGTEAQEWEKVKAGTLDIARVNLSQLAEDMPAVKLVSLPYLFRSREHLWRVLDGAFGERIKREADQIGVIVLTYYDSGTRSFYSTTRPIRSLADFKGLRIRIQDSPVYRDLIKQLGATPVVLPYDRVADALRKGLIDAAENNTPSYVSSGHYKVAKFYSLDEHSSVPEVLVVSKKTWSSLTPAQQKALQNAAEESSEFMRQQWAEAEVEALAKAKKEGVTVTDKRQIAMAGIEGYAVKLYSKYITDTDDLDAVLSILRTK